MQLEKIENELSSVDERVRKIESNIRVVVILAVIFGLGAGFGAFLLKKAYSSVDDLGVKTKALNSDILALKDEVTDASNEVTDQTIDAIEQAKDSIATSVDSEISSQLASYNIVSETISTVKCSNPRSGTINTCSCPLNEVLVGIQHHDVPGDKNGTEMVVGIRCGVLTIN